MDQLLVRRPGDLEFVQHPRGVIESGCLPDNFS
jgi:hypothetical protein